jgi:hypothetical protein
MSIEAISWALRRAPVASKSDLLVLIVLAEHAHADGSNAYPSVATIAALARMTTRGVQLALRRLEGAHLITATPRPGATTVYRMVMLTPESDSGANTVRPASRSGEGRMRTQKPPNEVHPNLKEPSVNREVALARDPRFSSYDEGVVE